jgi:transcription elongation GreA/GreB family factor
MRKAKIISEIQAYLTEELQSLGESDAPRLRELQAQLTMYRFLPQREYGDEDVAVPGALVELELGGRKALYLIVPQGGGLVLSVEGEPVQVITPQSPLGEAVLGRKKGDAVTVATASGERVYRLVRLA